MENVEFFQNSTFDLKVSMSSFRKLGIPSLEITYCKFPYIELDFRRSVVIRIAEFIYSKIGAYSSRRKYKTEGFKV